ncbi:CARBONIC ANHYDRASE [Salix koriyanagi]|uniref:Carbonic anhydrase n=1 Tax=Salix koriyanagi TaxID=2511006 RepID=A0A9Q0ZU79_9ROSI|nr:CARBONIC ANHYDRASE [Salix koriyanagi]
MVRKTENIKRNYRPFNATVKNRGHDIMVQWEGFDKVGSIQINGTRYFLQQCHWHSPSEHSINGRRYSMELHMLHTTPDQKIAVIGYLYRIGKPDAFLSKLLNDIMSMTDQTMETNLGIVDPREIKPGGKKYYRYMGSLTTPPCKQGVIWTINKKIRTISRDQVRALREAVHDYAEKNARPLQPLNQREIHFHGQSPKSTFN